MLKRIFTIALLTGAGQVFVVFALKYIAQNSSPEQVKAIGQIDSLVLFIMNVIALGLQPAAMRNLALSDDWKQEYIDTQSARLTLSIFLSSFAFLAFIDQYYLAFLIAPLLALSGDYALYGRGFAVKGSMIALARAIVPFLVVIIFSGNTDLHPHWLYLFGLIIIYLVTDLLISSLLHYSRLPLTRISGLKKYISTLPLGLVSLSLYFIGIGVILVAQYFYPSDVVAVAFMGLKFYVIYKGVLRILHQAFFKEMINKAVCLKVDQLSIMASTFFLSSVLIFPNSFISFFFGEKYLDNRLFFILLGVSAFIYSIFLSMATRSMLQRKDIIYMKISVASALLTIVSAITLSFFWNGPLSIAISILAGEMIWMLGLIMIAGSRNDIKQRVFFIAQTSVPVIIVVGSRYFFGDKMMTYIISLGVFSGLLLLLHNRKFRTLPIQ